MSACSNESTIMYHGCSYLSATVVMKLKYNITSGRSTYIDFAKNFILPLSITTNINNCDMQKIKYLNMNYYVRLLNNFEFSILIWGVVYIYWTNLNYVV